MTHLEQTIKELYTLLDHAIPQVMFEGVETLKLQQKKFYIQFHIKYLQSEIDWANKIMEEYIKEFGTDKHNGQLEYFVERKKKEIINAEKLIK